MAGLRVERLWRGVGHWNRAKGKEAANGESGGFRLGHSGGGVDWESVMGLSQDRVEVERTR